MAGRGGLVYENPWQEKEDERSGLGESMAGSGEGEVWFRRIHGRKRRRRG